MKHLQSNAERAKDREQLHRYGPKRRKSNRKKTIWNSRNHDSRHQIWNMITIVPTRDPRPTPGRRARPRWDDISAPQEIKDRVSDSFYIPKPTKPPGRLNVALKNTMFRDECRLNPFAHFHKLYTCHDKGREGSPTYDHGGLELDYEKVNDWMKPQAYNKK